MHFADLLFQPVLSFLTIITICIKAWIRNTCKSFCSWCSYKWHKMAVLRTPQCVCVADLCSCLFVTETNSVSVAPRWWHPVIVFFLVVCFSASKLFFLTCFTFKSSSSPSSSSSSSPSSSLQAAEPSIEDLNLDKKETEVEVSPTDDSKNTTTNSETETSK